MASAPYNKQALPASPTQPWGKSSGFVWRKAMVSPGNYVVYRDNPTSGAYHAARVADDFEVATNQGSAGPVLQQVLDQDFLQDRTLVTEPEMSTCGRPFMS